MSTVPPPIEAPVLYLDAASPMLCVGLTRAEGLDPDWRSTGEEAGVGIFRLTDALLDAAALTMAEVRIVILCDGPGSMLGIRLAAMAVRTWMALPRSQPLRVLAFRSLALVAADLIAQGETPPFHVACDARRETWNILTVTTGQTLGEIRRCTGAELPQDRRTIFVPDSFPHWQPLPHGARPVPYRPQLMGTLAARFPLWRETDAPDAFMTEMPTYRTWNPTPTPDRGT